jgi:hypothetical protein
MYPFDTKGPREMWGPFSIVACRPETINGGNAGAGDTPAGALDKARSEFGVIGFGSRPITATHLA